MNIQAERLRNNLLKEKKHLEKKYLLSHLKNIEKKILVSNSVGVDYTWYSINKNHYKYDNDFIISQIINTIEKKKFGLRIFIKNEHYLIQIIWFNK